MIASARVAIIGAGPYALSTALYLRRAGVEARVFGEVMGFWHAMPKGMFLRSYRKASSIADPDRALTLDAYEAKTGSEARGTDPSRRFAEYGSWFREQSGDRGRLRDWSTRGEQPKRVRVVVGRRRLAPR